MSTTEAYLPYFEVTIDKIGKAVKKHNIETKFTVHKKIKPDYTQCTISTRSTWKVSDFTKSHADTATEQKDDGKKKKHQDAGRKRTNNIITSAT